MKLRLTHLDLIIIGKIKIPKQELSVSICTVDTIGTIQSWKVLTNWYHAKSKTLLTQALMSLWLNDQPYLKALSQSNLVISNLWGPLQVKPKTQKVATIQDLRLPKFDKNRHINQQKVLVFDNNNVKYDIILSINLLSKTGFKSNYSEGNMEWFD